MAEISAAMVKELRDKTGSGIMDCKQALKECDGNVEEALAFLRKRSCHCTEAFRQRNDRRNHPVLHPHGWQNWCSC